MHGKVLLCIGAGSLWHKWACVATSWSRTWSRIPSAPIWDCIDLIILISFLCEDFRLVLTVNMIVVLLHSLPPITVPLALSHGCWPGIIILIYLASYKYNSHYQPARQYYNVLVLIQTRISLYHILYHQKQKKNKKIIIIQHKNWPTMITNENGRKAYFNFMIWK